MTDIAAMIDEVNAELADRGLPITVVRQQARAIEGCYQCGGPIAPDEGSYRISISNTAGEVVDQRAWHWGHRPENLKTYLAEDWPLAAPFFETSQTEHRFT